MNWHVFWFTLFLVGAIGSGLIGLFGTMWRMMEGSDGPRKFWVWVTLLVLSVPLVAAAAGLDPGRQPVSTVTVTVPR